MEQPEFKKIPEMCVKMIRRVNDEEGIKVRFLFYSTNEKYIYATDFETLMKLISLMQIYLKFSGIGNIVMNFFCLFC